MILFEGTGSVDGPFELTNSTRSELGGYAAPLLLVSAIARFWGTPHKCKLRWIVVDSTAAISKVQMVPRPGARPQCQPNNIDYLTLISDLIRELHRPSSITRVRGHQDETTPVGPLSRDALNNIAVDTLATQYRHEQRLLPRQMILHLASVKFSLTINGLLIPSHFNTMLRFHINGYVVPSSRPPPHATTLCME